MKFKTVAIAILALSLPAWCAPNAGAAFDSLKGLTGQWQVKDPSGKMQTITWQLISGGSVLMESMEEESMVTMYHVDKDHLMLTHYCSAHNQPRMQGQVSDDGKTFTFDFLDATNLASPADPHMHKLVLTILDKDHFTEKWFFSINGKDNDHGVLQFTRKK
ncbi:MAG TPA: hypothetical protein VJW20_17415 [Candidatus Angelobacter sp.]|nr:hypothetical protein [Candidatus Angelobacter sp.]